MKRLAAIALCVLMVLCLCACSGSQDAAAQPSSIVPASARTQPQDPTANTTAQSEVFRFPEGTVLCGADVSGMLRQDAYAAICDSLCNYSLALNVNGKSVTLSASDLALSCPETAVTVYAGAVENGEDPSGISLITYDTAAVRHKLAELLNSSARNATIWYDPSAGCFRLSDDIPGKTVDLDTVVDAMSPVVLSLGKELSVTAAETKVEAALKADSAKASAALAKANAYLDISLTYAYSPDNTPTQYESLSRDTIASFITFGNDLTADISSSALRSYVDEMSTKYSIKGDAGQFKTTGGAYIDLTVDYAGQPVNTDALYDDIHYCLTTGVSGPRVAPYLSVVESEDLAFDGNYVEVDLSAQHLWVYRNGSCVVSTPIVSGCANCRNTTPTGVYSIYSKSKSVYLVGASYRSYVNYWMPFKGGYGLHDASWRNSFGDDIYLYDGSHGCVNIPPDVAGNVYDNVSVGTKVILYGGATNANAIEQHIIGTAEYNIPLGSQPFKLDAQPEYGNDTDLTYVSSNPNVAYVDPDGTVIVNGLGTTYITVTAAKQKYYTDAQMMVTVNVYDSCRQDGHTYDSWNVISPATCTESGLQERGCIFCDAEETAEIPPSGHSVSNWTTDAEPTCTTPGCKSGICEACGQTVTEEIPTVDHEYTSGGPSCDFGCGTPNPNYPPPNDDGEDPTDPDSDTPTDPPQ